MRFELPFEESVFRKQNQIFFEHSYKKYLKDNKKNFIISTLCGLFGLIMIYGQSDLGYIFLVIAAFGVFYFSRYRRVYELNKKKYFDFQDDYIAKMLGKNNSKIVFEFSEDFFYFLNDEVELKLKWDVFLDFEKIKDDVLLMKTYKFLIFNFLVSKDEVGVENFNRINTFLESKFKKNGTL